MDIFCSNSKGQTIGLGWHTWLPGGPLIGPERHWLARRAIEWPGGPYKFLKGASIGHKHCSVNVLRASEPSRRLGSEVLRISVNPLGHVGKSSPYGGVFLSFFEVWL